MRGKGLCAEPAAAVVVFAPAAAVVAGPAAAGLAGLSEPAGCSDPGDSDGAWPHLTSEPGSTDSTPYIAVNKHK